MKPLYTIDRMTKAELDLAIEWAAKEGWNPGLHDAACFFATDPCGFFVGKLNDVIIAVGSAVRYDPHFAFCGFYIVAPEHREQGYGLALTKARLAYVGDRNAGIDGVINMLSKYERLGYKTAHSNARYSMIDYVWQRAAPSAIISLKNYNVSSLLRYDRQHFPAARPVFLEHWIGQPESEALGWVEENTLKGYGVIRRCRQGFKIGPLFADTPTIADALFQALASASNGDALFLDIPENNLEAIALAERYHMEKVFETARMYLKEAPQLRSKQIYGVTTFELG